jgi:hypothetical protein
MAMNTKKLVMKSFRSQDGGFVPYRSAPAHR